MLRSIAKKSQTLSSGLVTSKKPLFAQRSMASAKEIKFGVEGHAAMLRGVNILADAVQV